MAIPTTRAMSEVSHVPIARRAAPGPWRTGSLSRPRCRRSEAKIEAKVCSRMFRQRSRNRLVSAQRSGTGVEPA